MNRKALGWRDDPGHVMSIDSAPVLQYMKQGIFSFSLSPEFFERHHEAFVLSCGVGERLPDASLRVGGELREDRAVGPLWAEGKGDLGNRLGNRSCPWLGEDDQPAIVA